MARKILNKKPLTEEQQKTTKRFYPGQDAVMIDQQLAHSTGKGKARPNIGNPDYKPESIEQYEQDLENLRDTGRQLQEKNIDSATGLLIERQANAELQRVQQVKEQYLAARAREAAQEAGVPMAVRPNKAAAYLGMQSNLVESTPERGPLVAGWGEAFTLTDRKRQVQATKLYDDEYGPAGEYDLTIQRPIPKAELRKDSVMTPLSYAPLYVAKEKVYDDIKGAFGQHMVQPTKITYDLQYSGKSTGLMATQEIPKQVYIDHQAKRVLSQIDKSELPFSKSVKYSIGFTTAVAASPGAHGKAMGVGVVAGVAYEGVKHVVRTQAVKLLAKKGATKLIPYVGPVVTAAEVIGFGVPAAVYGIKQYKTSGGPAVFGYESSKVVVGAAGFAVGAGAVSTAISLRQQKLLASKGKIKVTGEQYFGVQSNLVKDVYLKDVKVPGFKGVVGSQRSSSIVLELPKETVNIARLTSRNQAQFTIQKGTTQTTFISTTTKKGTFYTRIKADLTTGRFTSKLYKGDTLIATKTGVSSQSFRFTEPSLDFVTKGVRADTPTSLFKGSTKVSSSYAVGTGKTKMKFNIDSKITETNTQIAKTTGPSVARQSKIELNLDTGKGKIKVLSATMTDPGLKFSKRGGMNIDKIKVDAAGVGEVFNARYKSVQSQKIKVRYKGEITEPIKVKTEPIRLLKNKRASVYNKPLTKTEIPEVKVQDSLTGKTKTYLRPVEVKLFSAPVTRIRPTLATLPKSKVNTSPITLRKTDVSSRIIQSTPSKIKGGTRSKAVVTPVIKTTIKPISTTTMGIVNTFSSASSGTAKPSVRIPPIDIGGGVPPGIGGFMFGGGGQGSGFGMPKRNYGVRVKARYKPSLVGLTFGRKASRKAKAGIQTGFGVRGI